MHIYASQSNLRACSGNKRSTGQLSCNCRQIVSSDSHRDTSGQATNSGILKPFFSPTKLKYKKTNVYVSQFHCNIPRRSAMESKKHHGAS